MDALIYFALWAGLIFLMMRFGCGAHVMGHGRSHDKGEKASAEEPDQMRWVAPETDTDPVCGDTVRTAQSKSSVHDGYVYYFCSRDCREAFEAAPDLYLPGGGKPKMDALEESHV